MNDARRRGATAGVRAVPLQHLTLMQRVQGGDQQALAALYDQLAPAVHGAALRVLRDPQLAEDVTQEAFVELWTTAHRFDQARSSMLAWAVTIVRRRAIDRVRREQSNATGPPSSAPGAPAAPATDDAVVATVEAQRVNRALLALPPDQREVGCRLAFLDGHSHTAIADRLHLPPRYGEEPGGGKRCTGWPRRWGGRMNRLDEADRARRAGPTRRRRAGRADTAVLRDPNVAPALHDALEAAARLQTAGAVAPPSRLRTQVLDAVAATPRNRPGPARPRPDDGPPVVPLVRRRAGWLAAAAATVALIVGEGGTQQRQPSAPDEVAAVVDADDVVVRVLQGSLGGRLEVVHSGSQDALVVLGDDLAPLAPDRTLQLAGERGRRHVGGRSPPPATAPSAPASTGSIPGAWWWGHRGAGRRQRPPSTLPIVASA
ncbi:MAG: sigma-70 family RNA polymerase sigma factor [Acidimicrobiales bacterium]